METLKKFKNKQKTQNKMHSKVIKAREGTKGLFGCWFIRP